MIKAAHPGGNPGKPRPASEIARWQLPPPQPPPPASPPPSYPSHRRCGYSYCHHELTPFIVFGEGATKPLNQTLGSSLIASSACSTRAATSTILCCSMSCCIIAYYIRLYHIISYHTIAHYTILYQTRAASTGPRGGLREDDPVQDRRAPRRHPALLLLLVLIILVLVALVC